LIVGQGAARLAADLGLEPLTETTPEQHESWREATARGLHHETVGAVALDENGNLCAASSTGGVFGKMSGRVGDSPVFGAGIYASAKAAAVGTGIGENFLQSLACARVGRLIEDGVDSQSACEETIELLQVRFRGEGGVLALDSEGRVGASYTGASWDVEGPTGSVQAARRARR
jgi:isoaspartyl peptidase/L-asparaginase-like protein (Ntn-hydrolase superfamily)